MLNNKGGSSSNFRSHSDCTLGEEKSAVGARQPSDLETPKARQGSEGIACMMRNLVRRVAQGLGWVSTYALLRRLSSVMLLLEPALGTTDFAYKPLERLRLLYGAGKSAWITQSRRCCESLPRQAAREASLYLEWTYLRLSTWMPCSGLRPRQQHSLEHLQPATCQPAMPRLCKQAAQCPTPLHTPGAKPCHISRTLRHLASTPCCLRPAQCRRRRPSLHRHPWRNPQVAPINLLIAQTPAISIARGGQSSSAEAGQLSLGPMPGWTSISAPMAVSEDTPLTSAQVRSHDAMACLYLTA